MPPSLKTAFLALPPEIMLFDGFGASETGAQGTSLTTAFCSEAPAAFTMDEHTLVLDDGLTRRLARGEDAVGWLGRTSHMPLGYLGDEAKTRRTYPVIGGERYAVPGDRAQYTPEGIKVFGRDSVCMNTGGEKVFAGEVEQALKRHPGVYDVGP